MKGAQRRVVARCKPDGLFPQRVLACQPRRAVADFNVREARLVKAGTEVCAAYPDREPLIIAVERLVLTVAVMVAAAVAGTAAPAVAAPAAGQSVGPGPTAVFSWGWNQDGENGDGTTNHRATPGPVLGLPSVHGLQVAVKQLAATNDSESCAVLLADGTVYTWGINIDGVLGDGTTTERHTPAPVPGLTGITQIALTSLHMLAAGTGGAVWVWGDNEYGQLGDGTTTSRKSPVPVPSLTGITQLAAGDNHSLALRSDGTVLSWGRNDYGELGTGTTTSRSTPGPVPGLTGIIQVAAAGDVSYALRSDGTLFAWGNGIVGNGSNGCIPFLSRCRWPG
jgi:alpha-tubulin suppressor-like RCC1 family protein